jgi:ribonuclease HI
MGIIATHIAMGRGAENKVNLTDHKNSTDKINRPRDPTDRSLTKVNGRSLYRWLENIRTHTRPTVEWVRVHTGQGDIKPKLNQRADTLASSASANPRERWMPLKQPSPWTNTFSSHSGMDMWRPTSKHTYRNAYAET